jgi:hypothetical protein
MGLDWNPIGRPKPGFEAEFSALERELDSLGHPSQPKPSFLKSLASAFSGRNDEDRKSAIVDRMAEIILPVYEILGAPRVGSDPQADAWMIAHVRKDDPTASPAAILAEHAGYHVLDLLPANPGFPVYSSWGYEGVDRYTFRAKFLDPLEPVLGKELIAAGYEIMTPRRLEAHGEELLRKATEWADRIGRPGLLTRRDPPDDLESEEGGCHITASAAQWCLYWACRGHGMEPYF